VTEGDFRGGSMVSPQTGWREHGAVMREGIRGIAQSVAVGGTDEARVVGMYD
jgi:hypothetical protein